MVETAGCQEIFILFLFSNLQNLVLFESAMYLPKNTDFTGFLVPKECHLI